MKAQNKSLSVWQTTRCWFKAVWVTLLGRDLVRRPPAWVSGAPLRPAFVARQPLFPVDDRDGAYATTQLDGTVVHGVTLPFDTLSPLFTDTVVEYLSTRPQETVPAELERAA